MSGIANEDPLSLGDGVGTERRGDQWPRHRARDRKRKRSRSSMRRRAKPTRKNNT